MVNGQNSNHSARRGLPRGRGRIRRAPDQLSTPDPASAAENRRRHRQRNNPHCTAGPQVGGSFSASSSSTTLQTSRQPPEQHTIGETSTAPVSGTAQRYRHRRKIN